MGESIGDAWQTNATPDWPFSSAESKRKTRNTSAVHRHLEADTTKENQPDSFEKPMKRTGDEHETKEK